MSLTYIIAAGPFINIVLRLGVQYEMFLKGVQRVEELCDGMELEAPAATAADKDVPAAWPAGAAWGRLRIFPGVRSAVNSAPRSACIVLIE